MKRRPPRSPLCPYTTLFRSQVKELTVVFTDLAGFTSLSEQLKEETVPLLNEYMSLMVPVIRRHKGYLNKFLRSEEHTSELQSLAYLVCRLLLEKKKTRH